MREKTRQRYVLKSVIQHVYILSEITYSILTVTNLFPSHQSTQKINILEILLRFVLRIYILRSIYDQNDNDQNDIPSLLSSTSYRGEEKT